MVHTQRAWPIDLKLDRVRTICQRYGVTRLALFGSVVRDDFSSGSDIDVLCTLRLDSSARGFQWIALNLDLADLWGRSVDLVKPELLDATIRDTVLKEARTIYVEACGSTGSESYPGSRHQDSTAAPGGDAGNV